MYFRSHMDKKKFNEVKNNSIHYAGISNLANVRMSEGVFSFERFLKCTRKMLFKSYFFARPNPL